MAYDITTVYDAIGDREDLTDVLVNITPKETYLVSNTRRTKAANIKHEWLTDALASVVTTNARAEGAMITASFASAAARTRVSAYCQLMDKLVATADSQEASNPAGIGGNEHEYQIAKAMKELARDMEYMYINQASATGNRTTAAKLTGLAAAITTNVNTATATRDYTYAIHQSISETIANAGGRPDVIYFKSAVAIDLCAHPASTGGGSGAVVISVPANSITDAYDMYRDMFGVKKLVPNIGNFAVLTATASAGVFQLQTDLIAQAFLQQVDVVPIARLGHAMNSMIKVEVTLEFGNELAHGSVSQIAN
jgi:hypothetical protein